VIELDYRRGHGTLGPVLRTINGLQTRLEHFEIEDEGESEADGLRHVSLYLNVHRLEDVYAAADQLRGRPEVAAVRVLTPGPRAA
jgi:hypothetical protein